MSDNGNGNGKFIPETPEQAKEYLEGYLHWLPCEMGDKIRRYNDAQIVRHFKGDGSDDRLESLLPGLRTVQAKDILSKDFPPMPWIVPGILAPGLAFLYGKPKLGKSWLTLQLTLSILTGGKVFGKDVEQGRVLYLALEDSERRLQDRMKKQGWPSSEGVDFMLYEAFREQIGSLNDAGGKRLLAFVESQKYRVVIVDTFSRALMGDQLDASEMTAAISPIQQSALSRDIAVVIVDHEPKHGDSLFGSVAKFGILDTSWRLYRGQGKQEVNLDITGRDVEEQALRLVFDKTAFYWHCEGQAWEIERTKRIDEILSLIRDTGPMVLTKIAKALNQDIGNTQRRLTDLVYIGQLRKEGKLYFLPEEDED